MATMMMIGKGKGWKLASGALLAVLLWGAAAQAASWSLLNDPQGDLVSAEEREAANRRAEEKAQLKRIRDLAAKEKAEAERQEAAKRAAEEVQLKRIRDLAAEEKAEAKAEAKRQEAAKRAAEKADLERIRALAERERFEAETARRTTEQAEQEKLRALAVRDRTEVLQTRQEAGSGPVEAIGKLPVAADRVVMPVSSIPADAAAVEAGYRVGPGDVLEIYVWKDEALTRSVVVSPDGRFSYPLVGEMAAEGKTLAQLKLELEEKVSRFIPNPVLSVEVRQANSMLVYILGRVNTPGRFTLNDEITVLQALAMAGGVNPFADRSGIKVLRQEGGETRTFAFHYDKVIKGKRLEENIRLKRGDVIVVP